MSKIIVRIQLFLDKVFGHKYTGFTIKAPFINFSFAPTKLIQIALTDTDFFIGGVSHRDKATCVSELPYLFYML